MPRCKNPGKKAIDYQKGTALIQYLHIPREKNCSKMLFLQGRFDEGETFKLLVDLSTQVWNQDGELNRDYSNLLQSFFEGAAKEFGGRAEIPDRNSMIYKAFDEEMPGKIIEKACFYQYEKLPGRIYY